MATALVDHFVVHFVAMARNNLWANHRLLSACEALSPEEFAAPRTGFFPSLRATLNHILMVDLYYSDALEGLDELRSYDEPDLDIAAAPRLRLDQTESDRRQLAFCERQTDESLMHDCVLPRPNRRPPPTKIAAVLEHLFQHDIHHRGQTHAMLSSTSVKPPQLDEFFLQGEQDLRRDELRASGLPET